MVTWNGQERRATAREESVSQELRDLLIRIDERTNRMDAALFGENGMDKRLRHVEQDNAATKAKSGIIAFIISTVIALAGIFLGKR